MESTTDLAWRMHVWTEELMTVQACSSFLAKKRQRSFHKQAFTGADIARILTLPDRSGCFLVMGQDHVAQLCRYDLHQQFAWHSSPMCWCGCLLYMIPPIGYCKTGVESSYKEETSMPLWECINWAWDQGFVVGQGLVPERPAKLRQLANKSKQSCSWKPGWEHALSQSKQSKTKNNNSVCNGGPPPHSCWKISVLQSYIQYVHLTLRLIKFSRPYFGTDIHRTAFITPCCSVLLLYWNTGLLAILPTSLLASIRPGSSPKATSCFPNHNIPPLFFF